MSTTYELDEVITVEDTIETGYFYMQNREFCGPFDSEELASQAALQNLSSPGECRAIYHGSARRDSLSKLSQPMSDMRQTTSVSFA